MNVEITLDAAAETSQWVKLPTVVEHTTNDNALFLSLIVGGDRHRGVLGSVGPYCSADTGVLEFLRVAGFSPMPEIGVGKAVNIGFKFKKYPRQLDPREQAFRSAISFLWKSFDVLTYSKGPMHNSRLQPEGCCL